MQTRSHKIIFIYLFFVEIKHFFNVKCDSDFWRGNDLGDFDFLFDKIWN